MSLPGLPAPQRAPTSGVEVDRISATPTLRQKEKQGGRRGGRVSQDPGRQGQEFLWAPLSPASGHSGVQPGLRGWPNCLRGCCVAGREATALNSSPADPMGLSFQSSCIWQRRDHRQIQPGPEAGGPGPGAPTQKEGAAYSGAAAGRL